MERITSQKEIVLNYLKKIKNHPSAENVYFMVRKELPRISRSTVYRILKNLTEKEEVQEIKGEIARYDGDTFPHAHFVCQECKEVFDVFEEYNVIKDKKIKVGEIKNYQIYFYGKCKKCSR